MSTNPTETPTLADAAALPPALSLRTAAAWLGISPTTAYRLVEQHRFPVTVHRIGTSLRVPTTALLAYLDITPTAAAGIASDAAADAAAISGADGPDASAPDVPTPVTAARAVGEPPRRGLYPVGRASVDGPRAG